MHKNVSARTKALLSACLIQNSDDEDKDNSNDNIEDTPVSSPTKLKKAMPTADVEPLVTGSGCLYHALTNNQTNNAEESGEKSIEAPPYSPLTPRPTILHALGFKCKASNARTVEDVREISLDHPPFSPHTLDRNLLKKVMRKKCMNTDDNDLSSELNALPNETNAERSIESSESFLLSPQPHCSTKQSSPDNDSSSSPLRPMTPETAQLFNILTESLDNDNFDIECTQDTAQNSQVSSDLTNMIMNSDDSAQDPDFVYHVNESSTSSSENSVSLITTMAEVYQIQPETRNEMEMESINAGHTETEAPSQGRPSRGRKRLYGGALREERKKKKYNNLSYVNSKKQIIDPKVFNDYSCNCAKKCQDKISTEKKVAEFNKFYSIDSYVGQNMYLVACVKERNKKRVYVNTSENQSGRRNNKTYSREYYLKDILVCKQMFLKTIQTSSKRINTALSKMRNNSLKDMRGQQAGRNVASTESESFLINMINKLPTYVSHYRRAKSNDTKFLTSDMTLTKIYEIYCEEAKSAGQKVLSYAKVRHVFVTKFNLRIKPLKKDTCNKCDIYKSKQSHASEEEKKKLEDDHQKHINKAQCLQQQLKNDMKLAKEDPTIETITFDLQKTLPLPRISTNVIFYKRQLWVYDLGIHTGSDDQAYCNVWVEGEAGRGSQEVGSCMIKHITERLKDGAEHLILWSDSCGGQNRNIKLTLMLKALLNDHPTLTQISHRFLESGHSFLPNDTDFGRIECALKYQQRLYTPEDYMDIMKKCKKIKPMIVQRLDKEDFLSSRNLEKKITNRKKAEDGSKISWLETKEIMLKKEKPHSIFMRKNLNEPFIEVNLKKNVRSATSTSLTIRDMDLLWPNGKPISEAKLIDLKSIMHLIPKDSHDFYKKLQGNENILEDDIDGFTGPPDFEVENDNGDF